MRVPGRVIQIVTLRGKPTWPGRTAPGLGSLRVPGKRDNNIPSSSSS
eukprot:SAG31_NODE_40790_length_279_cov_0.572222_1_plen_46_part_01